MALTLRLKEQSAIPLEVDSVTIDTVRELQADQVSKLLIQRGNREVEVGEFFDVSGSTADDETMVWEGDCSKVKLIANKLSRGLVRVEGNAGMHLGAEMTGGEVYCSGNVADWVGAELHGGRIHVKGNAGHLVGAVYRGGFKGMTGGEILIEGDAGNEIGAGMRRGLIAIGGRCGDFPGSGMIAGTILIFGAPGIRPAPSMKRGTVAFFDTTNPPDVLPTYRDSGVVRPSWLTLYLRHLESRGFPLPEQLTDARYRRFTGDHLELGKGEVLVRLGSV